MEGGQSGSGQAFSSREIVDKVPGNGTIPQPAEAGGEAGKGGFQVIPDLTVEGRAFADEIATMADEQLQRGPRFVAGRFLQGAAGDGGAMDGIQIGIIGFVAGIDGLAILFGDEGVEDAGLEAGGGKGALNDAMIPASAFDGDEAVAELVLSEGQANLSNGGVEVGTRVGDGGRWDQDATIKVSEQELGADLGAGKADDAEVFGTDLRHAGMEDTAR